MNSAQAEGAQTDVAQAAGRATEAANAANADSLTADVAIIGAGPAGLTAAYLLGKAGYRVVVVEKDPTYVGGISRTVTYKGFRFDIGGHRFFSKSKEVVELWNELLPDDFIERPRMSRIYYDGKYYSYPLRAFEALFNLGIGRSVLCMASYVKVRLFPRKEVRSFEDWIVNQFGYQLYAIFFKSYTEKVWGMSCTEMSADWAAQRIKGLSLAAAVLDGLKRSLGLGRKPNDGMQTKTLLENFRYPRLGPGMMWEATRDKITAQGGRVVLGYRCDGLVWHAQSLDKSQGKSPQANEGYWQVTASQNGSTQLEVEHGKSGRYAESEYELSGRSRDSAVTSTASPTAPAPVLQIKATHVISSAPLRELAAAIEPLPQCAETAAAALSYRDFLTVVLMIRAPDIFPDNWIYIHDSKVQVGRVQNYRSWSPHMVPDADIACVGLEYFCFAGDGLWSQSDSDLISLAARELAILGLARAEDIVDGTVVRQEKAYPVYDDNYAAHVAAVRSELETRYPTLHMVGRNGMHRYNNQDHAMMTAMLTVRNIVAGQRVYDIWEVNEDAEYHESGSEGERAALRSQRAVPTRLSDAASAAQSGASATTVTATATEDESTPANDGKIS